MPAEPPPAPLTDARPAAPGDRELLAAPARQSPIALIFIALRFVRRLGISALVAAVIFVTSGGLAVGTLLLAAVAASALLVFSVLSWWRFTFAVHGDELVVTRGVASVERLVIPIDRVQSVAIDQRLTHRMVGVVRAAVDTAGSEGVEFEIDAIDRPRAEALRRVAADARQSRPPGSSGDAAVLPPPTPPEQLLLRRSFGDLMRVGATKAPWAGLVALAPLIALGDELDSFLGVGDVLDRLAERGERVSPGSTVGVVGTVLVVVVVVSLVGAVLQIVREVVANWDLRLVRTATGLRRTAGLLTTTSRSSTLRRVQMLTTDDSPPQRRLGFTNARLHAFGDNDMSLPGSTPDEVERLRRIVFGDGPPPILDRRISGWWVYVAVRPSLVVAAAAAIVLWLAVGWWSLLALLLVPARVATARRQWRLRRWGLSSDRIAQATELVSRHTVDVPIHKAQVVTVSQSLLERRRGLATVSVRTAGGDLTVPMIPLDDAAHVRDRVLHAAETDRRRFL